MANRRASITLYSRPACVHSHRVRLVMEEKGVTNYDIVELREGEESEDLQGTDQEEATFGCRARRTCGQRKEGQ